MKKRYIRYIWMLSMLLLFSFLMFTACSKEKEQAGEEEKAEVEIPEFKDEIYGDPDIFDSPRIQFYWEAPGDGKRTIWSTKLDGSDLRRSTPLHMDATYITHPPVRSPDSRYIIASIPDENGIPKMLYDLKTNTVKEIANGGGMPFFQWTPDSQFIIFYLDGELVKYSLKDDKIIKMPGIYSRGIYVLNDNKRILAIERRGYKFYSLEGKVLKSVTLIDNDKENDLISMIHAATADGTRLMYQRWPNAYVIDTSSPDKPLYKNKLDISRDCDFGPYGKNIYFSTGIIKKLNIETGKIDIAVRLDYLIGTPGSQKPISFLSIFNTKAAK